MPANAIEKIEIITQPGAEFPATSGGAIWILLLIKMLRITWARLTLIVPVLQAIMVYGGEWTTASCWVLKTSILDGN
jgi:hypothetical protein